MHVLTPPYHFSIVACPLAQSSGPSSNGKDILYRGSIPHERNYRFLRRLGIRTLVYLKKKPVGEADPLVVWAGKRNIELKWIKAEHMTEEKLGMGKGEINEVMKIVLDPSDYPVYLADGDGVSHTVLVIACLRKLMGWHIDSIIGEICRFEPEYEDYSLVPFITSYLSLSTSSSSSSTAPSDIFTLPPPPYPSWLWPQSSLPLSLTRTSTRDRSSSATTTSPASTLPFPHPLVVRRHPTMKLGFGNLPPASASTPLSPSLSSNVGGIQEVLPIPSRNPSARVPTRTAREDRLGTIDENKRPVTPTNQSPATGGNLGLNGAISLNEDEEMVSEEAARMQMAQIWTMDSTTSPDRMTRRIDAASSTEQSLTGGDTSESDPLVDVLDGEDDEYFDEDEEEEDEEDEDADDDLQSTSQYISALDLAGY